MELLLMLLVPLPLGFFMRNRLAGYLTYIAVHGFAFTFQSLYLTLSWVGGETSAFGRYPKAEGGEIASYGLVNLAIFLAGLGLLALGQWLRIRRHVARAEAAEPAPVGR